MLSKFKEFFSNDIGIDLGTANTLVYLKDAVLSSMSHQ